MTANLDTLNITGQNLVIAVNNLNQTITTLFPLATLNGSATFNPPSIADGASASTTVTVTGAVVGDYAFASFSNSLAGLVLTAYVSAADTVTCIFANLTGAPVDLASGILSVRTLGGG